MTQSLTQSAAPAAAALVRVTVVAGERRADLALPGGVPVAELLPELARTVGVLDAENVYGGYGLRAADGRLLAGEAGLVFQGVEDGGVLTVEVGAERAAPRVYDDIVEAMGDAVEQDARPWDPAAGRRTALAAAALLLALGVVALGLQRPDVVAGAAAGAGALVLLAAAWVVARVQREPAAAVVLGWSAVAWAACAGWAAAPAGELLGLPVALAGAGGLVAASVAMLGLRKHRTLVLPGVLVGAVAAVVGAVVAGSDLSAARVAVAALVVVTLAAGTVPWFALAATRVRVEQVHSDTDLTAAPREIVGDRVRDEARFGHEVVLAVTVALGLVLVLASPLVVPLGVAGTLVGLCAAAVLLLRTRRHRAAREVTAGLTCGLAGLAALAGAVVAEQPAWRPALAVALAAVAAALLVGTLVPSTPSVRRGRAADVAELVALVALLPLLVVAIGLLGAVRS